MRFQVLLTKRTKVTKDPKNNLRKFWVNSTILTIFLETWLKEQVSMVKLMKSYQKFWQICKDLLQQERCKLNNLRTVLRREDLELDRIFLQCIQINHHHKILDFSFLHQWFSQHNLNITTCTRIRTKIRTMIWVKCWQIFWNQSLTLGVMCLKDQFTNQNGNDCLFLSFYFTFNNLTLNKASIESFYICKC